MLMKLKAPFPYFGGKSKVADIVWERFGDVPNYVEPFAGSLAVLLGRPHEPKTETVNDKDCFISNFWRALQADPETVAHYAEWPVNENDLHARHAWLTGRRENIQSRMEGNPEYYDARAAGWWVWGISCWIGSGWCSGAGPWRVAGGELLNAGGVGQGVNRKRPHLGDAGRGGTAEAPRGRTHGLYGRARRASARGPGLLWRLVARVWAFGYIQTWDDGGFFGPAVFPWTPGQITLSSRDAHSGPGARLGAGKWR